MANVWEDIKSGAKKVGRAIDKNVIQPVVGAVGSAGKTIDKNVTSPIISGVKSIGREIDENVISPVATAVGLKAPEIPDSAKPQLDPAKTAAMAEYGGQLEKQGQQFDPSKFGQDYFQPQQYNPVVSSATSMMPGIYSPQQKAPSASGVVAAPQQQQVQTGRDIQLRDVTTGNMYGAYGEQAALTGAMNQAQTPLSLASGYDQNLRQTYVDMATSGLNEQKEAAMAQLKEQQMKAGNYGSSVGQKQMMDLQKDYDRQVTEAGKQADLMQMEGEREDRYRNLSADQARVAQMAGLAGQSAGIGMSVAAQGRDTVAMQNEVDLLKEQYRRQGIQIDNDTAMRLAGFQSSEEQRKYLNDMTKFNADTAGDLASYDSQWQGYEAMKDQKHYADSITNEGNRFNIGQKENADLRNYQAYQDYLRNMAGYGANPLDPQSVINNQLWAQQQAEKNARLSGTISAIGAVLPSVSGGMRAAAVMPK